MHLYFIRMIHITSPHAMGYGVGSRGSIHGKGKKCSLLQSAQTVSGAHPVGTGGKAAGA